MTDTRKAHQWSKFTDNESRLSLFDDFSHFRLEFIMETISKDFDTRASWIPRQNQLYEGSYVSPQTGRQQLSRPQNAGQPTRVMGQKSRAPEKMPKARALALANTLKRWLAIASIVGFGTFGGLVALHQVSSTTTTSQSTSTNSSSSSSSQNSNGFFKQQGGNTSGTSSSSSSSSSSAPVSGTHTS